MTSLAVDEFLARTTDRKENPLGLFIAVIKERPNSSAPAHKLALKRLVLSEGYEDFIAAIIDEWEAIKYSTALRAAQPPTIKEIQKNIDGRKKLKDKETKATEMVKKLIGRNLLSCLLPNGYTIAESTFGQCTEAGGIFHAIGKLGKKTQIVGQLFSEKRLRAELINCGITSLKD